jgi:hypothetical protein
MDTNNSPTGFSESKPPKKDSRNLIIVLLAIGFLGTAGYVVYNNNDHNQVQQTQESQVVKITDDKNQVQKNFDNALVRLDSMTGFNNKIQGMLTGRQNDVAKLKLQIRGILKKEKLTEADTKTANTLIVELNGKISTMEQTVAQLTQSNLGLALDTASLNQDKGKLTSDLETTTSSNEGLAKKVDIASTLNAANIMISPVQDKKNGEEKITDKAKKVSKLKISFDLTNRIAASGQADVFICITGPDNKMILDSLKGSGSFTTREEGDKMYTTKLPVEFESGKIKSVQFSWKQESGFQIGLYKIEIYHNGYKIGEGTRNLKKGGLFS